MRVVALFLMLFPIAATAQVVTFDEAVEPVLGLRPTPEQDPAGAMLDWYPAGTSGFRLTGGFRDAERGRDSGERRGLAPYLGIGWQGAMMEGKMLIGLDMGAFYSGRPDLRAKQLAVTPDPTAGDPAEFRLDPVFSLTFSYRF